MYGKKVFFIACIPTVRWILKEDEGTESINSVLFVFLNYYYLGNSKGRFVRTFIIMMLKN